MWWHTLVIVLLIVIIEAVALGQIKSGNLILGLALWAPILALIVFALRYQTGELIGTFNALWCGVSALILTLYGWWFVGESYKWRQILSIAVIAGATLTLELGA